jgi:excisionase family DNA binding protein
VEQKTRPDYQKVQTMNEFMTIKEVGAYLRLSAQSVKRLIREGRLTAHRFGQCSYRISGEAIQALLAQTLAKTKFDTPAALDYRMNGDRK